MASAHSSVPLIQENSFNIIDGTASNDLLTGTSSNDLIRGFDGTDVIRGLGGNDLLVGGAGRDIFVFEGPQEILSSSILEDVADIVTIVGGATGAGAALGIAFGSDLGLPGVAAGGAVGTAFGFGVGLGLVIGSIILDAISNNAPNNASQVSSNLIFASDPILGVQEANGVGDSLTIPGTLDDLVSVLTQASKELEDIGGIRDLVPGGITVTGDEPLVAVVDRLLGLGATTGQSIVGGALDGGMGGFGRDIIKDFEKGSDLIQLDFSGLTFDNLNLLGVGNNTVIDLSSAFGNPANTDTITVAGVTNLERSNFILPL
jgi:Ca2+-binding RTX toxin-like protein